MCHTLGKVLVHQLGQSFKWGNNLFDLPGHMQFSDTTRKGSLHSSMFEEVTGGTYQLCLHGPIDEPKESAGGRTTLNSMCAGLMEEKEIQKVKCEYDKINRILQEHKNSEGKPKPQKKPKLNVELHGIPVHKPRKRILNALCVKKFITW